MREPDTVISLLKELRAAMDQIKNAQRLAGDGWIVYRTATSNTWDINATLVLTEVKRWLVTFTPDVDKQVVASIDFAEDNDPTIGLDIYRQLTAVPGSFNQWYYVARLDADFAADEATFKAKFVVSSTSTGALSITAL